MLNADGRAVETHLPDGTVTYATYDAHGDVTSTTDALGNVTTFAYDARGNAVKVTDALGGTTINAFDLANRLTHGHRPARGTPPSRLGCGRQPHERDRRAGPGHDL